MRKLIFKTDKNTMGDFKYVGFRKWVENGPAMGTDLSQILKIGKTKLVKKSLKREKMELYWDVASTKI